VRRLGDAVRYIGGELAAVFAIAFLMVSGIRPIRVPDLRRLTARPDVAEAHDVITPWLDRHFELIESEAPWLHRVGRRVEDSCRTTWRDIPPFSLERKPARVACTRRVRTSYGCDGDLQSRLTALASALSAIGWGDVRGGTWDVHGGFSRSASQMRTLSWLSARGLAHELPSLAGQSGALGKSAKIYVSWADRAEPDDTVAPPSAEAADRARATLLYQPVEVGDDAEVLAARVRLSYENAIMIDVSADYYQNENVNARPDRLRKRLRVVSGF
jgi:hypothetical protein